MYLNSFELIDDLFNLNSTRVAIRPVVTVEDDNLKISCDLPGVKKEDVDISVEEATLRIAAKRYDTGEKTVYTYRLKNKWDIDSADVMLSDGVLTIKMQPRVSERTRKLTVK